MFILGHKGENMKQEEGPELFKCFVSGGVGGACGGDHGPHWYIFKLYEIIVTLQ